MAVLKESVVCAAHLSQGRQPIAQRQHQIKLSPANTAVGGLAYF